MTQVGTGDYLLLSQKNFQREISFYFKVISYAFKIIK